MEKQAQQNFDWRGIEFKSYHESSRSSSFMSSSSSFSSPGIVTVSGSVNVSYAKGVPIAFESTVSLSGASAKGYGKTAGESLDDARAKIISLAEALK